MFRFLSLLTGFIFVLGAFTPVRAANEQPYWMKVTAHDKFDRTKIAATGVSLEVYGDDYVMTLGSLDQAAKLEKMGLLVAKFPATQDLLDFPTRDSNFHNYSELKAELEKLVSAHPQIAALDSIGKSVEGRELFRLTISKDLAHASELPAFLLMGGHHAREHVSVEVPLMFAQRLLSLYDKGDADAVRLIATRNIQIVPLVNPDGAEWDIQARDYRLWRKNRTANSDGSFGVDINRNYSEGWDAFGGSSTDPGTEVFRGRQPFSEPETRAVKTWVESTPNVTTLLSLHAYSALILYPWGKTYDHLSNSRDRDVFETMAQKMSTWNGYAPMQSSSLYIVAGELCDWAYAQHKIFAFTFEIDPSQNDVTDASEGFYPGEAVVPQIFEKNFKPILYMLDTADNPYKVLEPAHKAYGFSTELFD